MIGLYNSVELWDDDADDDERAGLGGKEAEKEEEEEKMDVESVIKMKPRDVQPTGRVVGVVKRNWRA